MHVSLIGTNGFLSESIALACNDNCFELSVFGRREPRRHAYTSFHAIDLIEEHLDCKKLVRSDLIIYTAGAGIQSNLKEGLDLIYNLNVVVPVQICNRLKELAYKGAFVSFGSYFEIGENASDKAYTEIDVLNSQFKAPNDYVISKRMLSRFFSSFSTEFTFLHFILPTIYGERESNHRLIPYTLNAIERNIDLSFTSGMQIRQYIYISDLVNILFRAVSANLTSGVYNVAGAEELSVKQLVSMLFELKGRSVTNNVFGKAERLDVGMKILKLDGKKLQRRIGHEPKTKISQVYNKYNLSDNGSDN